MMGISFDARLTIADLDFKTHTDWLIPDGQHDRLGGWIVLLSAGTMRHCGVSQFHKPHLALAAWQPSKSPGAQFVSAQVLSYHTPKPAHSNPN